MLMQYWFSETSWKILGREMRGELQDFDDFWNKVGTTAYCLKLHFKILYTLEKILVKPKVLWGLVLQKKNTSIL